MLSVFFSRPGKSSVHQFKILRERSLIHDDDYPLSPERKLKMPRKGKQNLLEEFEKLGKLMPPNIKSFYKASASFKAIPRNSYRKDSCPGIGHYNVNYDYIQKRTQFPRLRHESHRFLEKAQSVPQHQETIAASKRIPGLEFSKQTPRKEITDGIALNENRFNTDNLSPSFLGKNKLSSTPNFQKCISRNFEIGNLEISPEYNPDKEKIMPKLGYSLKFSRMTSRHPLVKRGLMNRHKLHRKRKFQEDLLDHAQPFPKHLKSIANEIKANLP